MFFSEMLEDYAPFRGMMEALEKNITPIGISGVTDSAQGHLIYEMYTRQQASVSVVVCYSDMEAKALYHDISFFTEEVYFFPSKEYVFYNIESKAHDQEYRRLEVLYHAKTQKRCLIVTSIDALLCYTAPADTFGASLISLVPGQQYDPEQLVESLMEMGYIRDEMTESKGQFSVRGGIIDIFSPQSSNPIRIEFFDNEIDSLRIFDPETQRTIEQCTSAAVIPCSEMLLNRERKDKLVKFIRASAAKAERKKEKSAALTETLEGDLERLTERGSFPAIDKYVSAVYGRIPGLMEYIDGLCVIIDPKRIAERAKRFEWEKNELITDLKEKLVISSDKAPYFGSYADFLSEASALQTVTVDVLSAPQTDFSFQYTCDFTTRTTVSFHGKIDYLIDDLESWKKQGYTIIILAQTMEKAANLRGVLSDRGITSNLSKDGSFSREAVTITEGSIRKGFEYPQIRMVVVSDREIFEGRERRKKRRIENTKRIKSYNEISIGDYVVHQANGIGIYEGIKKMTVNGVSKDYLKISYRDNDVLYVPVSQLDVLYKYAGDSDKKLKLSKLGGAEWSRTKSRVKKSTQDIAKQLVTLYAQRERTKGFAFSPDTPWQREFEDTFGYTETEDQLRSIEEVKADMEKERPMDRLLCGDVGFGKTEIALRAAFKAVMDSKQVAYLCPTTVLAMQHFNTFTARMRNFPVKVEMLSRFRTPAQQREILKKLKTGEIDILIGTHRILQKDLVFKDLGLLVVDEEQRFGVAAKERLKELKRNIDVLTMTATPIPRTLHMSMISVRDMSVLSEPPENRYPVQTYVLEDNASVLLDAMRHELARGGQVFYLFNRVQGIYRKAEWIKAHIPEARVAVGHGQMSEGELEDIMYDMVNGDTDILVCTTIIETGLDIPNANTIIIENADRMGLSQLYQLRGRVGRSNRSAYAYLTYRRDKVLSDVAQKRLRAVKEFTEFGSGFKIALRDLEIRGAGNVLGAEQHGHMDAVGYDLYCKLLKESVDEENGKKTAIDFSVTIDLDVNAFLPERYIRDNEQRIDIYKKIAAIETSDDKLEIEDELIDRYGDIPKTAQNVIEIGLLKAMAKRAGIFDLSQKSGFLQMKFNENTVEPQTILELGEQYKGRVKLIPAVNAVVNFRLKDIKNILGETREVLNFILEREKRTDEKNS